MSWQCQGLHLHLDSEHGSEGKGSSWVRLMCPIPKVLLQDPSSQRCHPLASTALKGLRFA